MLIVENLILINDKIRIILEKLKNFEFLMLI